MDSLNSSSDIKPIPKTQFSTIIPRLFNTVTVCKVHGYRVYKGLKYNDIEDKNCEPEDIKNIAEEHGFICISSKGTLKYAVSTGHYINGNEIYKTIEIHPDRSWNIVISGHEIDPVIIGLQNMRASTLKNVKIMFNTVKKAPICKGKPAEKDQQSTQF